MDLIIDSLLAKINSFRSTTLRKTDANFIRHGKANKKIVSVTMTLKRNKWESYVSDDLLGIDCLIILSTFRNSISSHLLTIGFNLFPQNYWLIGN